MTVDSSLYGELGRTIERLNFRTFLTMQSEHSQPFMMSLLELIVVNMMKKNVKKNTRKARNPRNTHCYPSYPPVYSQLKKMNEKIKNFLTNTRKPRKARKTQHLNLVSPFLLRERVWG
jgi:hypothetical protein